MISEGQYLTNEAADVIDAGRLTFDELVDCILLWLPGEMDELEDEYSTAAELYWLQHEGCALGIHHFRPTLLDADSGVEELTCSVCGTVQEVYF